MSEEKKYVTAKAISEWWTAQVEKRLAALESRLAEIAPTPTAAPKPAQDTAQDTLHVMLGTELRQDIADLTAMTADHTTALLSRMNTIDDHIESLSMRQINHPKVIAEHAVKLPPDTGAQDEAAYTQMRDQELKRHHLDDPQVREWTIAHHTDEIHALQNHFERVNGLLMSLQANNAAWFKEIADVDARVEAIEQQQLDIDKLRDRIAALEDERGVRDRIIAEMRARIEALEARTYPLPYVPTWPQYDPRTPPVITKTAGNTGPCCDHRPASHQQGAELHDAGAA